jgi:uncharacterized repeat protein (TIGR03847 family)
MSRSFDLPEADWATIGTVGEPGHRTFYLQARQGDRVVTLKLEKQQVATLAEFILEILSDLPTPGDLPDLATLDLIEPVLAEWAVGRIQLAYDNSADRVVILADEIGLVDPDEADDDLESTLGIAPDLGTGRFGLTRSQAAGMAGRGIELVGAGRPPCALCGHPIEPEGHSCPRTNGHRPPAR